MKPHIIIGLFVSLLVLVMPSVQGVTTVGYCNQSITESGHYEMNQTISPAMANCFIINTDDVVFDCKGYSVDGQGSTSGAGFNMISGHSNITIKNCHVIDFSENYYFQNLNGGGLYDSTGESADDEGIKISVAANQHLMFKNISINVPGEDCVDIGNNAFNNTFYNINCSKPGWFCFVFQSGAYGHNFTNAECYKSGWDGIILSYTGSSHFKNVLIHGLTTVGEYGIRLDGSDNNVFENVTIRDNVEGGIILRVDSDGNIFNNINSSNNYNGINLGHSDCNDNQVNNSYFCFNTNYDINDADANYGNENICNTTINWNDDETSGCTYYCSQAIEPCTDEDGDGYGVCPNCNTTNDCTYDGNDCNDNNTNVNPGATEACNNIDDNCDNQTDENLARECGEGTCLGNQTCFAGEWDNCSSYGIDAGVCAVCDTNGSVSYDETQDYDCEATTCPGDGCGVDACGTNIWGNYPDYVSNECLGIYTCTQNTCNGTADCGPDDDSDEWSPQCGDCNDTDPTIHPGADDPWGDGIDQNCDGIYCGKKTDYTQGVECALATVAVHNDTELEDYLTDYGYDGNKYKNLKIAYDVSQTNMDIHSPCKINVKAGTSLTGDTVCLDGRRGVLNSNGYTVNASHVAVLSELGNSEFGQGSVADTDELYMEALKTVKIGLNSIIDVDGVVTMISTGDLSSSDARIKRGSEMSAGELLIEASRSATLGKNVNIDVAGNMTVTSTGDYTGSQAEFLQGAEVTVGGNLSLTSGNKAFLRANTNTTVTGNFHMNAQSENKCTIKSSATYTAGTLSGNCLY